jgi:hypothetical protein
MWIGIALEIENIGKINLLLRLDINACLRKKLHLFRSLDRRSKGLAKARLGVHSQICAKDICIHYIDCYLYRNITQAPLPALKPRP